MKLLLVLVLTFLAFALGAEPDFKYVKVDSKDSFLDLKYNRNSVILFEVDKDTDKEYRISYKNPSPNSPNLDSIVLNKNTPTAKVKYSANGNYEIKNNVNDNTILLRISNLYVEEKNHKENDVLGKEYKEPETYGEYSKIVGGYENNYNNNKKSADNNNNLSNQQNDINQVVNEGQVNDAKSKSNAASNTDAKATAPKTDANNAAPKSDTKAAAPKTDAKDAAPNADTPKDAVPKSDANNAAPKTDAVDNKADNGNNSNIISASIQMVALIAISLVIFF